MAIFETRIMRTGMLLSDWLRKLSRKTRECKHIPVGMTDKAGNIEEVFCQECAADMTLSDWNKFWNRKEID